MLIVLPPSETKVSGGDVGTCLDMGALSFPSLNAVRTELIAETMALAQDGNSSLRALKLGPKGMPEVIRNREITTSPTLPALSRYSGVLYDAVSYHSLASEGKAYANSHVAIFSALFGLIRASDPIPAYRLSWDSAIPGGRPTKRWAPEAENLWASVDGFVLDLRSEGYRSLSPVPSERGVFVSLVKDGPPGARKAVGHYNKGIKGQLVRDLVTSQAQIECVSDLCGWGGAHNYFFDPGSLDDGAIELVVQV